MSAYSPNAALRPEMFLNLGVGAQPGRMPPNRRNKFSDAGEIYFIVSTSVASIW